jgi:hypothetical protein
MNKTPSPVGDLASQERGSGARFNGNKPPLELIPIRLIVESWGPGLDQNLHVAGMSLARFQEGGGADDLHDAIRFSGSDWDACAQVFDYGRKKYAEWNWAKGMSWNVVIGCAARHWKAIAKGEETDAESGLSHRGHFMCNLVMLLTYLHTYRAGDDRPVQWLEPLRTIKVAPVEADIDSWLPWDGRGRPVDLQAIVDVRCRSGRVSLAQTAEWLRWTHSDGVVADPSYDIIAYRLSAPSA